MSGHCKDRHLIPQSIAKFSAEPCFGAKSGAAQAGTIDGIKGWRHLSAACLQMSKAARPYQLNQGLDWSLPLNKYAALLCLLVAHTSTSSAASFSLSGNFSYDNDVQAINFIVDQTAHVSVRSWSYAGGLNANGALIPRGGFDPGIALFDAAGMKIAEQDDAGCALTAADPATDGCWDIFYSSTLTPGNYTLTIMQYHNVAYGTQLSDGFLFDGAAYRQFRDGFIDDAGVQRTGFWAIDLLGVADAVAMPAGVPEPDSLALLGLAAAALAAQRRRKNA